MSLQNVSKPGIYVVRDKTGAMLPGKRPGYSHLWGPGVNQSPRTDTFDILSGPFTAEQIGGITKLVDVANHSKLCFLQSPDAAYSSEMVVEIDAALAPFEEER